MKQITHKPRRVGKSEAEAMFIKEMLLTGSSVFRVCKEPPDRLIAQLKNIGVNAQYSPVYTKSRFQFIFNWWGEVTGIKKQTENLSGYTITLKK